MPRRAAAALPGARRASGSPKCMKRPPLHVPIARPAELHRAGAHRRARSATNIAPRWTTSGASQARGDDPLGAGRGRSGRIFAGMARGRLLPPERRGQAGGELLDRDPAAERDRRAAHGPRAQRHRSRTRSIRLRRMQGARTRSGSSAPTTPGSAPRPWSRRSSRSRGPRRHELGREAFVERVWEWREQYGSQIIEQSSASGRPATTRTSASRSTRATSRRSTRSSSRLYERGYIYRDNYMVNWDPGIALGDLRPRGRATARSRTRSTRSTTRCEGSDAVITVATVRPETMLADTAVAVHPDDERYSRPRRLATRSCRWSAAGCR